MPSISTCIISQLTALQRDCLICVNSIPQPCRTQQRSKCQDRGMRKIKERAYVGSNGGERQIEFTDAQNHPPWCHYLLRRWIRLHIHVWLVRMREAQAGCCCCRLWCVYVCVSSDLWVCILVRDDCCLCAPENAFFWACALLEHIRLGAIYILSLCVLLFLPLCTHILLLNRHTGHLAQPHTHLDVSKLQTQVLPKDGHPGSALARPCFREQLQRTKSGKKEEKLRETEYNQCFF